MLTEFKAIRKAFRQFSHGTDTPKENTNSDVVCKCKSKKDMDLVCAESTSIESAFMEYCRINLVEVHKFEEVSYRTKRTYFNVKYFSEGMNIEFEVGLARNNLHTVACLSCDTCLGTYVGRSFSHPSNLCVDDYVDSPEIFFDKIFRKSEKKAINKLRFDLAIEEKKKRAREICGYK